MLKVSLDRLGGWSLICGPLLAIVFFLVEPGGLLIDTADPLDPVEAATALASNSVLTDITALGAALGTVLGLFGLFVVQRQGRSTDEGYALSLLGFFFVAIGITGSVIIQGLNHVVAHAKSVEAALPVYQVSWGMGLTTGIFLAVGLLGFSLGLACRDDINRTMALLVALASALSLVCLVIGVVAPADSQLSNLILIAGVAYVVWIPWTVVLGVGLIRSEAKTP